MNILITGGAGFIGSHLAERLLREGHRVWVVDDLSTGSLENIDHLRENPQLNVIISSVTDKGLISPIVARCDLIFHLAAAVGVQLVVNNPIHAIEVNVKGTETILELAAAGKKRVLITSTSEVYGKSEREKFSETDDLVIGAPSKSRWSYAISKALDESLALAYHKERELPVVIVRLFNTVGPRQTGRYGMVIPRFVRQALTNQPITVYGDGTQTRTFTHVKDAVDAMIKLALHPNAPSEIFNVGGKREISIKELAFKVKELLKSNSEIVYIPYEKAYEPGFEDMRRRVPDISKVRRWIGYEPRYTLDDIIIDVAEYMKRELDSE